MDKSPTEPETPREEKDERRTIVGRAANPHCVENWEEDFDIPNSLELDDGILSNPLPMARAKSGGEEKSNQVVSFSVDDPFTNFSDEEDRVKSDKVEPEPPAAADESDDSDWDAQVGEALGEEIGSALLNNTQEAKGEVLGGLKAFDSGSDVEAWDAGGDTEMIGISLELEEEEMNDENDIKQHSLMNKLLSEQVQGRYNIVTYPEPPELHTKNLPEDSRVSYQDQEMVFFLKNLAGAPILFPKDIKPPEPQPVAAAVDSKKRRTRSKFRISSKSPTETTTTASSKSPQTLELPRPVFKEGGNESLKEVLSTCMTLVRENLVTNPEHVAVIVEDCSRYMTSNLSAKTITDYKDDTACAEIMYSMLHATAQHHQLHPTYIRTAVVCFPTHAPLFNLLKFECKAHHDGSYADLWLRQYCRIYYSQKKITDEAEKQVDSKGYSLRVQIAYNVQAQALASLHLYLDNRSPLDWKALSREAQYDPLEDSSLEWLLNAFEGKALQSPDEQFEVTYELCGHEALRMRTLRRLYDRIRPFESLSKAQAGFALAKYLSEGNLADESNELPGVSVQRAESTMGSSASARVAENIIFECIVVLDKLGRKQKDSRTYIKSIMGVSALVLFGEILNANSKYQYAVHTFESAIKVYHYVYKKWYYEMVNTLSTLCEKQGDWKRALKYHLIILDKAKLEGNLNLYVYIVQQISKIHTKAGDFLNAVKHLRSAIEVLNQCIKEKQGGPVRHHTLRGINNALDIHNRHLARLHGLNTSKKVDHFPGVHMQEVRNQKVNLYLRLAQHFLDAKRIIEAIVVLEFLLDKEGKLPRGKISVVHLLLATAYTKKRLYRCANELIEHMQKIAQEKKNAPNFNVPGAENVSFNAEFTPILGVSPSEVVKTREFVTLCAKNAYSLGRFSNSTLWTRISMRMSDSNPASLTLGQRGNLHYRMGKILQGVILSELITLNLGNKSGFIANFPNTAECMREFDQAYTYFDKVEDQVHIAKTLSRIVETYLHVAFTTVGLLGQPIDSLTIWLDSAGFRPEGCDLKSPDASGKIWENFLGKIERPAFESLEVSVQTYHAVLYLKCLINVAEIRFLQGKYEASLKFWRECKNTFFTVAMNSERCVMVDRATPGMTSNIHAVFQRLVRLLVCFHPDMINHNLVLLDSYNLHTIELYADVEQCSPLRLWSGGKSPSKRASSPDSGQRGLRKQRMLHMRGIREDVDIFMNNDTEVMLETRRWLRQRKTPEPLTQEKHWRKHLSAFMGAVGSRSMSKSLHHDLAGSMMYDNYLDRDSYKKAIELRDAVCSLFYQISLNVSQATAGRFSQKELIEKNRGDLHDIVRNMDQLRALTYSKSGRAGGIASAFSPTIQKHRTRVSHIPSRRASSVWMSEFSNSSSKGVLLSRAGDPLWANLTYCIPLGSVVIVYSPQLKAKMVRMVTSGQPIEASDQFRVRPDFLSKLFEDFVNLQNVYRRSGKPSIPPSTREAMFFRREEEVLSVGKNLGMLRPTYGDSTASIVPPDFKLFRDIIDEKVEGKVGLKSTPVRATSPTVKATSDQTSVNTSASDALHHRGRLPSSQFLENVDEESHDGPSEIQRQSDGSKKHERAASLYEVFDELQDVHSSRSNAKASCDLKSSPGQSPLLNRNRSIPNHKATQTKQNSVYMKFEISLIYKPPKFKPERGKLTLEIFNSREMLGQADTDDLSWKCFSIKVNAADTKQVLWFVVRRRMEKKAAVLIGQNHLPLERLKNASYLELKLEDNKSLHSNKELRASTEVDLGSLVIVNVQHTPCQRYRDDSLVQSLTFPDRKGAKDTDSHQAVIDKLVPPTFDIMLIKELLAALDRQNILALLSGMFNECQIILTSQNNFRLKAAINCILRLMYPFQWQHTLVPLLPRSCVGMLTVKTPYIIAVNQFVFPSCIDLIPPKAIVAFLDHNQIRIRPGSFIPFPSAIKNRLSTAIQQFRVMLFRSLVTHKDAGMKAMKNGSEPLGASTSIPVLEMKVTSPGGEIHNARDSTVDSQFSSFRMSQRMLANAAAARPEVSLQILKRNFLACFVELFYKFRLYWTRNPSQPLDVRSFLKATNSDYRPFIDNFVRTKCFGAFVELRSGLSMDDHNPTYVFDEMVYKTIYQKLLRIRELRAGSKKGKMLCQKGKGRWKMRSVEVLGEVLNVYKYNKRKGAKYTRKLSPGYFQVEIPEEQVGQQNYFAFELRNIYDPQKNESTLSFRVNSEQEREDWIRAIRVRIMDSSLRERFESIVSKFEPRFKEADQQKKGSLHRRHDLRHKRSNTVGI